MTMFSVVFNKGSAPAKYQSNCETAEEFAAKVLNGNTDAVVTIVPDEEGYNVTPADAEALYKAQSKKGKK